MKLIIAGSRELNLTYHVLENLLNMSPWGRPTEIISGACGRPEGETELIKIDNTWQWAKGIDGDGESLACACNIPLKRFNAQWTKYGLSAGPKRNKEMAEYADALLLIWFGTSKGSASMKREMRFAGKPIFEVILPKEKK